MLSLPSWIYSNLVSLTSLAHRLTIWSMPACCWSSQRHLARSSPRVAARTDSPSKCFAWNSYPRSAPSPSSSYSYKPPYRTYGCASSWTPLWTASPLSPTTSSTGMGSSSVSSPSGLSNRLLLRTAPRSVPRTLPLPITTTVAIVIDVPVTGFHPAASSAMPRNPRRSVRLPYWF